MADFALWATSSETAFGWPDGTFMAAYQGNRASANEVAIEASLIAHPLLEILEQQGRWEGSSAELLRALEDHVTEQVRCSKAWPKGPRALSGQLKRLAPNLRKLGWDTDRDRNSKKRSWIISRRDDGSGSQPSSEPSQPTGCEVMSIDADCCGPVGNDANDGNDATAKESWNPDRY